MWLCRQQCALTVRGQGGSLFFWHSCLNAWHKVMEVFTGLPGTGLHLVFLVQESSCLTAPAPPLSVSRFFFF